MEAEEAEEAGFVPGSLVEAVGLKGRLDLNGKRGVINGRVQGGRLGVEFPPPDGTKALRPPQLLLLREGAEAAPMPQRFPAPLRDGASAEVPRRRLLAYGDSLTAGYRHFGMRFSSYAASLAERLLPEVAAEIWVCGLSSLKAEELLEQLDEAEIVDGVDRCGAGLRRVLREQGPFDLALLMAGTNDLGSPRPGPEAIAAHVRGLHAACHREGVRTVALSVPPSKGVPGSKWYCRRWRGVNVLLRDWARGADGAGVALFVDTEALVPYDFDSKLWEFDGLHLSEAGSRQLGEGLAPLLKPLLARSES